MIDMLYWIKESLRREWEEDEKEWKEKYEKEA